jgi:hypothetical protein
MKDELLQKVKSSLDHKHPNIITWREFISWFQKEGEVRENVHNAQLYKIGLTRIYEIDNIESAKIDERQ